MKSRFGHDFSRLHVHDYSKAPKSAHEINAFGKLVVGNDIAFGAGHYKPYTKRAAETRMGKGKGPVEYWVAVVKPGRILFEVGGTDPETAKEALLRAKYKLSVKSKIVTRDVAGEA